MTTLHRFNKEFILRSKFGLVAYIVIGGHGTGCFGASTIKERSGGTKKKVIIWNSKFLIFHSMFLCIFLIVARCGNFLFLTKKKKCKINC